MRVNGLYEASGLVLWLRTGVSSTGYGADHNPGDVSVEALLAFVSDFFDPSNAIATHVQRGAKKSKSSKSRLLWPCTMVCSVDKIDGLKKQTYDGGFNLVGSHFLVWGWYLSVAQALARNAPRFMVCVGQQ